MAGHLTGKGYDIEVRGVKQVLNRVERIVNYDLAGTATSLAAALSHAMEAMDQGQSNALLAATAAFRVSSNGELKDLASRVSVAANGCTDAVNAYARGDREMAANAARNTTLSPKLDQI
jgi:hypothetical protein